MWADGIAIGPPGFDNAGRLTETVEQVHVETFVPQPAIERFHKRILRRLYGCNVVPFDAGLLHPYQDRVTGLLRAVVGDDHLEDARAGRSDGRGPGRRGCPTAKHRQPLPGPHV